MDTAPLISIISVNREIVFLLSKNIFSVAHFPFSLSKTVTAHARDYVPTEFLCVHSRTLAR